MGRSQEGGDLTLEFHPGGIFWGISHPEFPAPRSRLSREKRFGKGSKFGICAAASSLENIPKPRGLFLGGDKREKLRHATGWEFPNSPKSRRFGMRDSHSRPWRCRWLLPARIAATSGPPRCHRCPRNGMGMGRNWSLPTPFPPHSRRIPGRCPPAAEIGDSDNAGRRRGQMATAGKGESPNPRPVPCPHPGIWGFPGVFGVASVPVLSFYPYPGISGISRSFWGPSVPIQGFQGPQKRFGMRQIPRNLCGIPAPLCSGNFPGIGAGGGSFPVGLRLGEPLEIPKEKKKVGGILEGTLSPSGGMQ